MFDLLGVRYLVAKHDLRQTDLNELLGKVERTELLYVHPVTVGGVTREAIFQHAPNETPLTVSSPFVGTVRFDYGVHDAALLDPAADGVVFSVVATHRSGTREVLWQGLYAPGSPDDPETALDGGPGRSKCRNRMIPWSSWPSERTFACQRINGLGRVEQHPSRRCQRRGSRYNTPELVANIDGTYIFENPTSTPRAFLVHDVTVVPNLDAARAVFTSASDRFSNGALRVTDIDVTRQAVVEASPQEVPASLRRGDECSASGPDDQVEITKYEADRVVVEVTSSCDALLVLSDTHFPGWQATVDGELVDIHPTDMALRGVVVGPGRSEVVFSYRPASFRTGIALAAVGLLAICAAGLLVRRSNRKIAPAGLADQPSAAGTVTEQPE